MALPTDSTSSSPPANNAPPLHTSTSPQRSHTIDVVEHRIDSGLRSLKSLSRRKVHSLSIHELGLQNRPYLEYVQQLVAAGWSNLADLEKYLVAPSTPQSLIVSVLDISSDLQLRRHGDIYDEVDLSNFMVSHAREGVKVRYYVAEYQGSPSAALIETLGSGLKLDPRFFQWSIHSKGHVFTPSQRHRASYVTLGFGVLNQATPSKTDAERFKVLVYIQPNEDKKGWTAIILISSQVRVNMSPRILTDPPPFLSQLPPSINPKPRSFRELYLESMELLDLDQAVVSPFYAISNLLRMNCFCWNQIITTIREEDKRINGISDTSIGHAEEIKRSLSIVRRGGSLKWPGLEQKLAHESQLGLEEDFQHLVEQTDLLWQNREKMAALRKTRSDARWTWLTNVFTYLFAPVTIMTGVYGMNVSQISGSTSNPNIWQFFVAVAALNVLVLVALSASSWLHIQLKHGRAAGFLEVLGYAVGKLGD